jgi:hemolysin III
MLKRLRDPASGLSHLLGAVISVVGLVLLVLRGVKLHDPFRVVSYSIFGASLIMLYSASATYHLLKVSDRVQVVLRKLDHIMIFVLIAGTYTPICLVTLRGTVGYALLVVIWTLALAGLVFKIGWLNAPRWLYTLLYVIMGWIVVFLTSPLLKVISWGTFFWLLAGGVFYTVGAVI